MKIALVLGIFSLLFVSIFLVFRYCKNKVKIILATILILMTLYFTALTIDANRVVNFKKPIFAWDTKCKCANEKQYQGLGYKVNIYYLENGNYEKAEMYMFGKLIVGVITNTNSREFTIIDETEACDTALELIGEDDNYKYYFECIKSDTVFIVFADGSRISIREAQLLESFNWIVLVVEKYPNLFYKEAKI